MHTFSEGGCKNNLGTSHVSLHAMSADQLEDLARMAESMTLKTRNTSLCNAIPGKEYLRAETKED
jgi:hypothetical protein